MARGWHDQPPKNSRGIFSVLFVALPFLRCQPCLASGRRVVRHDRIITSAGVSSGIDMALRLAALLADETTAQAIQLYTEYDPQPPFDSGSMARWSLGDSNP